MKTPITLQQVAQRLFLAMPSSELARTLLSSAGHQRRLTLSGIDELVLSTQRSPQVTPRERSVIYAVREELQAQTLFELARQAEKLAAN